jgi:hypothetical protein
MLQLFSDDLEHNHNKKQNMNRTKKGQHTDNLFPAMNITSNNPQMLATTINNNKNNFKGNMIGSKLVIP